MVMDLAHKIGVLLAGRFQHHLPIDQYCLHNCPSRDMTYLGAIGELVRGEIDLAEGALPNQPAQCVITYGPKVLGGELPAEKHNVSATFQLARNQGDRLLKEFIVGVGKLSRILS